MLLHRLDFGPAVRESLAFTFERWNGKGYPTHAQGESIPLPMRIVHLSHDMEALARLFSPDRALEAVRDRRDRTYDPALADLFIAHGGAWLERLRTIEPWDAVLALEPAPHRMLQGETLDTALLVAADFIDMKSPYMNGHSRRCGQLAADAARVLGFPEEAITALRHAALVHDFGTTAVPNSIWDKPGPLTRAEFDRVERHPMLTEQMLRRSPALEALNPIASAHHEKCDGSGYHKRVAATAGNPGGCVLSATEIYVGLTTDRADRPAIGGVDHSARQEQDDGDQADAIGDAASIGLRFRTSGRKLTMIAPPRARRACAVRRASPSARDRRSGRRRRGRARCAAGNRPAERRPTPAKAPLTMKATILCSPVLMPTELASCSFSRIERSVRP